MDIKKVIKQKGLTVKEVAERMGIAKEGLSVHLNGNPSVRVLERIAEAVGCEVGDFFTKSGEFIAFVRCNGKTSVFDTPDTLKEFVNSIE